MAKTIQKILADYPYQQTDDTVIDIMDYFGYAELIRSYPYKTLGQNVKDLITAMMNEELMRDMPYLHRLEYVVYDIILTLNLNPGAVGITLPAEFLLTLDSSLDYSVFKDVTTGRYYSNYDYASKKPTGTTLYARKTGNDTTGNGSTATPYRTLQKCKDMGADVIVVGAGFWDASDSFTSTFDTNKHFGIVNDTGAYPIVSNALASPSAALHSGSVYKVTGLTNVAQIIDLTYVRTSGKGRYLVDGVTGVPIPFSVQTSVVNVQANQYSFYDDGVDIYIHAAGGAAPNFTNVKILPGTDLFNVTSADDKTIYLEGVEFFGVHAFKWSNGQNADLSLYVAQNCGFRFSRDMNNDGNDGDSLDMEGMRVRMKNCQVTDTYNRDGYNYTRNTLDNYTSDCLEEGNGYYRNGAGKGGSGQSWNGTTYHVSSRYVRLSCDCDGNNGGQFADTQGTYGFNAGCTGSNSLGSSSGVPEDFFNGGAISSYEGVTWYLDCSGTSTRGFSRATGAQMILLSGNTGTTQGTMIDGTVQANVDALFRPVNTVAPVVSGTATVGSTLSCTTGTWSGIPVLAYSYQWQRDGGTGTWVDIAAATASTYDLVLADAASQVRCNVLPRTRTYEDQTLYTASASSNATALVSASDTTPNLFGFADVTGATTSTLYEASCTPIDYDGPLTVTVNTGAAEIRKNGTGSWVSSLSASPGETINARMTSSASGSSAVTSDIQMGSVTDTWSITTAGAYDSDASTWFTAVEATGATISGTNKTAFSDFVIGLKSDGLWSDIAELYMFAGIGNVVDATTLGGIFAKLKGSGSITNTAFVFGDYSATAGLLGDGTSKFLDSGWNYGASKNSLFAGMGFKTAAWTTGKEIFGNYTGQDSMKVILSVSSGNRIRMQGTDSTLVQSIVLDSTSTFSTNTLYDFMAATNTEVATLYMDGSSASSTDNLTASSFFRTPNTNMEIFKGDGADYWAGRVWYFVGGTAGWDSTKVANFRTRINTLKTALGVT